MSRLRDIEIESCATDQYNFKIILLKRLKQLLSKLIRPFPKNGQSNLEIRVIRASNKGPDLPTIFVYSRCRSIFALCRTGSGKIKASSIFWKNGGTACKLYI
jgi:hypothetical protein